jgi:hypothetical protein
MKEKIQTILIIIFVVLLMLSFLSTLHSQVGVPTERFDTASIKPKPKVLYNQFRDFVEWKQSNIDSKNKINKVKKS